MSNCIWKSLIICFSLGMFVACGSSNAQTPTAPINGVTTMTLEHVKHWVYIIQNVQTERQREQLVGTHFDMYVLEPVITDPNDADFNIAKLVHDIRQYNISSRKVDPIILAYIDMGQAESWRWYFDESWETYNNGRYELSDAAPDWIVGRDPNAWENNYPVAFWETTWQDIVISGYQGQSHVDVSLDAGFDGIYMDWVEAFSDESVLAYLQDSEAVSEAAVWDESATRMFDFIEEIRDYARVSAPTTNPNYLVIAQNASDLRGFNPRRYDTLIDAVAIEGLFYEGIDGSCHAFDNWDCKDGYNVDVETVTGDWTQEILEEHLPPTLENNIMPVFCAEYAQFEAATKVYQNLAPGICIPYATRRSLSQLSTTPYPEGYLPQDY